ncbi:MAG: hypothetical protein WC515_07200 [Candidatus Omnitrophota bacterium]
MDTRMTRHIIYAAILALSGIAFTLFARWEPGGESWGYWLFARIFAETGKFIVVDRSPLYILYLNLFRWMGYPLEVIVEYCVTFMIAAVSFIALFKRYAGLVGASFAFVLWMPFFQMAEPHTQQLALASACLAVVARGDATKRSRMALSYALLLFAYMIRYNYLLLVGIFIFWDILRALRRSGFNSLIRALRPGPADWPLFIAILLLLWFKVAQSPHPWNNIWFSSAAWFPGNGKSLADAAFIQDSNFQYIFHRYGSFHNKDFYFTNHELFGGATDMLGAVFANPGFVARQLAENIKGAFCTIASLTMLPPFYYSKPSGHLWLFYSAAGAVTVPLLGLILYGAVRASRDDGMRLFLAGNILLLLSHALSSPSAHYMGAVIPVFILGASWYGNLFRGVSTRYGHLILPLLLIFFSNGPIHWSKITGDLAEDVRHRDVRIMETRPYSIGASFRTLEELARPAKGIMALESAFIGAFMSVPLDRVYDIWEIPPFGRFGSSDYNGLRPDRIDRVFVSHRLATDTGKGTNMQIRYDNYILPYTEALSAEGAHIYDIEKFGKAYIMPGPGER